MLKFLIQPYLAILLHNQYSENISLSTSPKDIYLRFCFTDKKNSIRLSDGFMYKINFRIFILKFIMHEINVANSSQMHNRKLILIIFEEKIKNCVHNERFYCFNKTK